MEPITLSTGRKCPRCGCDSLSECANFVQLFDKEFSCVALCGMSFGLNRMKSGKIAIYYDTHNESYLSERFKLKEVESNI